MTNFTLEFYLGDEPCKQEWQEIKKILKDYDKYKKYLSRVSLYEGEVKLVIKRNNRTIFSNSLFTLGTMMRQTVNEFEKILKKGLFYFDDEESAWLLYSKENNVCLYITKQVILNETVFGEYIMEEFVFNEEEYVPVRYLSPDFAATLEGNSLIEIKDEKILQKLKIYEKVESSKYEWIKGLVSIADDYAKLLLLAKEDVYKNEDNYHKYIEGETTDEESNMFEEAEKLLLSGDDATKLFADEDICKDNYAKQTVSEVDADYEIKQVYSFIDIFNNKKPLMLKWLKENSPID